VTHSAVPRLVAPAITVALLVTISVGVTHAATISSAKTVTFCADTKTHAVTISGKCGKRQQTYTVDKTGPRGPRGVAGSDGVTHALFDSNGNVFVPPGTRPPSSVLVDPGVAVVATLSKVPAGTYLINATTSLETADDGSGLYVCSTLASQTKGNPTGVAGIWEGSLGDAEGAAAPMMGEVNFTATGKVEVECDDFNTGPNVESVNWTSITLVPVSKLTATSG
jgi:hypothetical protein